jgi:hypothetical protein
MTMALTQQELDSLAGMSPENLIKLLGLIREAKALYGYRDGMSMPPSAVAKMTEVVGDQLMKDIVKDLRKGRAEPGWFKPTGAPPVERGTGWVKPLKHSDPSGQRYVDQMMDVQDALDRRDLERRLRGG